MANIEALKRLMRGADPLELLAAARNRPAAPEPAPFPETVEEFLLHHCYWPHIDQLRDGAPLPVCSLNAMQRDFLARRTSFRLDADGQPMPGGDCILKSRRIQATSMVLGMMAYYAMKIPSSRFLSVFQVAKKGVIEETIDQVLYMLRHLKHPEWLGLEPGQDPGTMRVGNRLRFPEGSRWDFQSAGHNRRVAAQLGRGGGTILGLHLSEARSYAEPEEVWQAAGKAVTRGWIVSESTPPTHRENWAAESWLLTDQGQGEFGRAFFWPWHLDPLKRIPKGSPSFAQMHKPEFVEGLPPGTLEEEARLGLDDEQRAFRRKQRHCGTAQSRRLALAEFPETLEESFDQSTYWLDRGAIAQAERQCCDPLVEERLGTLHTARYWLEPGDVNGEQLVLFVDTALKHGKDKSAIRGRLALSKRVAVEVHGRALASELCAAIVAIIKRYCGSVANSPAYCVGVERNAGSGKDLLELLQRAGLRVGHRSGLYAQTVEDQRPGRKGRKRTRPGLYTGAAVRSKFLDRICVAVEGPGWLDGEPVPVGPSVEFRSAALVDELSHLAEVEGRIAAASGHHDDIAIADAGCLWLCELMGRRLDTGLAAGGSRSPEQFKRRVKKRHTSRRLG